MSRQLRLTLLIIALLVGGALGSMHDALALALALDALAIALLVALTLARRRSEARHAAGLKRSLRREAESHLTFTRPDRVDEIGAMTAKFMEAVETLRSSKLGKSGYEALYSMPWYMIIGPPGSGKTTAIRSSGLDFPLQGPQAALRGFGGTRNCEWWLTNDAVLLDTAGRYTSEDDDHEEWLAFLDLLRTYRPRKPIEGVIVAIGVDELGGYNEDEVIDCSRQVRARVSEIMRQLEMIAPVYVLFTKCDLIAGFIDVFGGLTRSERGEIWGFTLPATQRSAPGSEFAAHFDRMVRAVEEHAFRGLLGSRRVDARARMFTFAEQLRTLGPSLGLFVNTLFADNVYQENPILRGVYFTSGTQEGSPVDRVMHSMTEALGLAPVREATEPTTSKSYFLARVFTDVMFPDCALAMRSANQQRRRRALQIAQTAGLSVTGFALAGATWVAYAAARSHRSEIRDAIEMSFETDELRRALADYGDGPALPRALHMNCRAPLPASLRVDAEPPIREGEERP